MGISDVYSANMIYPRGRYEINPINYTGIIIPITILKKHVPNHQSLESHLVVFMGYFYGDFDGISW
jgi:hypothetical protein